MSWILSIVAIIMVLSLRGRVQYLEKTVKQLTEGAVIKETVSQTSETTNAPVFSQSVSGDETVEQTTEIDSSSPSRQAVSVDPLTRFFRWFAVDWLMKIGAILLFLGIGWIVTVVFWDAIGEVGQVSLGLFLGIAILFFGMKRIGQYSSQGSVLLGLGAGVTFFTLFAARTTYDMFSPASVLIFMFFVAVFVAYVSVTYKNFPVALMGLFLGGIAPLLTASAVPSVFGLFSYLFVLCLGTLWVVRLTGWRNLTVTAIILYGLYTLPFLFSFSFAVPDQGTKVLFAILFASLFFVASILSVLYDKKAEMADLVVSLINGLILLGWIVSVVSPELRSIAAVLVAIVSSVGAFAVYSLSSLREPVYTHALVAGVFIGMATAFELHGALLTIAYILEATALVLGARFILQESRAVRRSSVVLLLPAMLSFTSLVRYSMAHEFLTADFFVLLLMTLMFFLLAPIFLEDEQSSETSHAGIGTISLIVGSLYALVLVWLVLHNILSSDQATTIALLLYTIIGMVLYVNGKMSAKNNQKVSGTALLIFVVGHLLLIDVWGMDVVGRIVTFSLVGVLLMSTAFIGKKRIE